MTREFCYYTMELRAGPASVDVVCDITYYDDHDQVIGSYGESMIAFATTWRDIALLIRTGLKAQGEDHHPVMNVSPMVDLT